MHSSVDRLNQSAVPRRRLPVRDDTVIAAAQALPCDPRASSRRRVQPLLRSQTHCTPRTKSKHRVGVRRSLRNTLEDIPVLHDLPVRVEPKNVDTGPRTVAGPFLETMQHDEIALGDSALDVHPLAGILPRHSHEIVSKRLLAIPDGR